MFESKNDIFETLAEAIPEGVIVVDSTQKIVGLNKSTLEMFGYDRDELLGQLLTVLVPVKHKSVHGSHFEGFYRQSERREMGKGRDLNGLRKDGVEFPLEVGLAPFTYNNKKYVMGLLVNITERKKIEQRILQLNDELEIKVQERTKALNETVETLQKEVKKRKKAEVKALESLKKERELNELKTKFLSLVSHEFKTPLSGILTSALLAGKYEKQTEQDKRLKHLELIKNKVHYLDNILNDFLSVERLDSGKVNYRYSTFELSKVLNEVIYNANMLLKSGQTINYPDDADTMLLDFDEQVLTLVISNILSNAIKYSPENTIIDIRIKQGEEMISIEIEDQGMGIPEHEQKHIFDRYFRAENAINDQGTGIGLNIVKSHLDNLGGSINFISEENKGTTFIIQLPTAIKQKNEKSTIN
ncbi:PAS domain-containing sensor histidine kinase [Spongiivirga sp. MCCC 1A20706]|uniref:PAS domain-containing sensor histidine kinase n=1 Tax=Spongiivirga sp. MCCC 1A20706 TaxID=3160963 RepID=UPI003977CEC0